MYHKHMEWIMRKLTTDSPQANCAEWTIEMNEAFPELKRVRGHYNCLCWGRREHWWLIDKFGAIVDPTVTQFPTPPLSDTYEPWEEGAPEPTGKCLNCGDYCFNGDYFCCDSCQKETTKYMNSI